MQSQSAGAAQPLSTCVTHRRAHHAAESARPAGKATDTCCARAGPGDMKRRKQGPRQTLGAHSQEARQ